MRILLTRPQGKGEALAKQLTPLVDFVAQQSVIDVIDGPDMTNIKGCFNDRPEVFIFVSINAVDYLQQALANADEQSRQMAHDVLSHSQLMAVGQSTAKALGQWLNLSLNQAVAKPKIATPEIVALDIATPEIETSEGLLQIDRLQHDAISGKKVAIVRGLGGRELLAEQLTARGAMVSYWQMYQRQAVKGCGETWWQQWQTWQIDTIVVTSVAIVEAIIKALPKNAKPWWQQLKWICASPRIAAVIEHLDVPKNQIYVANGANNAAMLQQIKTIDEDV